MTTATRWWHARDDQIVCDLCPRECALHEGQRGFCFVRQNVGGEMVLTTYGRSSGFCVDPIEKKPLNQFLPGTPVLSFGTAGCNLGCKFCQNWSISKAKEFDTLADQASPEAIAGAAKDAGCRSVAFTYNDPVIWAEYAIDTAHACHDAGLKTVAVTAGYISPAARKDFYDVMDAANVDLKAFTEKFYKHLTLSKLEPVLDTLRWLKHESDVWFEITNLMIPDENDSADEIERMCDWIVQNLGDQVPVHFTAFHPDFRMRDKPPTPAATLLRAREQALRAGIKFPYVGNVHDVAGQSTYCPNCGIVLIERDWYQLGIYRLKGNRCGNCGTVIPGVFEDRPGDWGPKRLPIRISPPVVQIALPKTSVPTPVPTAPVPGPRMQASEFGFGVTDFTISVGGVAASSAPVRMPAPAAPVRVPAPVVPDSLRQMPVVDFSAADQALIVAHARAIAEATLLQTPLPQLPEALAAAPTYGVFVTFRRAAALRACRGRFGDVTPLGSILAEVARDSVMHDPRFPSIAAEELPRLYVEVSLMFGPSWITARGDARMAAVQVGRHGLVLNHPRGRGLLLPQVATEANWDSHTFLKAVSGKAGLPHDAWRDDAAQLMTFEARVLHSEPPVGEFDAQRLTPPLLERLMRIAEDVLRATSLDASDLPAALTETHATEIGLAMQTASGKVAVTLGTERTLAEMAATVARSLRNSIPKESHATERVATATVLWQPIPLVARDYPDRQQTLYGSALVARWNGRWGLHIAQPGSNADFVAAALNSIGSDVAEWRYANGEPTLTAFAVRQHQAIGVATPRIDVLTSEQVRRAARAGQFYPDSPAEIESAISRYLAEGSGAPASYRAVMLPHAGWMYCGSVIGRTLSRVTVPRTVIVISPKHTPHGANWSVSSAERWEIPGATIPVATEIRGRLLELVPGLVAESDAHRQEHGVEVLLPFLHRLNPQIQVVPIVLGPTAYSQTQLLARALAIVAAEAAEPPLIVISSDMNHFAPEPENRRLDMLAVDAMLTGDPSHLFDTVRAHNISMCGVMPAVTVMRALRDSTIELRPELVHYTNSGQVTGDASRVVGYAGVLLK